MKIEINTNSDTYECDTCGMDWAEGGTVYVDGVKVLDAPASAHCYSGTSYDTEDLLIMALHNMGHQVFVDGDRAHVTSHHDDYHGKWVE